MANETVPKKLTAKQLSDLTIYSDPDVEQALSRLAYLETLVAEVELLEHVFVSYYDDCRACQADLERENHDTDCIYARLMATVKE